MNVKRRSLLLGALSTPAWPQAVTPAAGDPEAQVTRRNDAYGEELEKYFRGVLVDKYPERAAAAWNRSYESASAFLASVETNRKRYRRMFAPPDFKPVAPVERRPSKLVSDIKAEWLSISLGPLKAEGLFVVPANVSGRVPLVIAQHGIGSFPERVFGVADEGQPYKDYGHALVKAGFAVLAPFNLRVIKNRNRIERLARLADTTLPGIEFRRMQVLLDEVLQDKRINPDRIGMWGISLGGMATMFWMPLERRIRCGIVTAWFNHRRNKMVIPDKRYTCFLETTEEHAFFRGWLTEFTDSDVASLICPRPLMIQHGKKDRIAWWPQVIEEFDAAKEHYRKLNIAERIEFDLHEGVHEIDLEPGLAFLKKWLRA
ncbi:MAG: prolyl oligopeptidase family serine peptidase [Bryobacteraceae bacterium]